MSEKTHKPTKRRLKDARKKGEVARSAETTRTVALLGMLAYLGLGGAYLVQHLLSLLRRSVLGPHEQGLVVADALALLEPHLAVLLLPPVVLLLIFSLLGDFAQVRGNLSFEPLIPKFERIHPGEGFKRIFSLRSLVQIGLSLFRLVLTLAITWLVFTSALPELVALSHRGAEDTLNTAGLLLLKMALWVAGVHVVGAVLDHAYTQFDYLKQMRMSVEELKREFKEQEGDPLIRGRRKVLAIQWSLEPIRKLMRNKEPRNASI